MLKPGFLGFSENVSHNPKKIFIEHLKAGALYCDDLKHMANGQNKLTRVLSNEKNASLVSLANLVPLSLFLKPVVSVNAVDFNVKHHIPKDFQSFPVLASLASLLLC